MNGRGTEQIDRMSVEWMDPEPSRLLVTSDMQGNEAEAGPLYVCLFPGCEFRNSDEVLLEDHITSASLSGHYHGTNENDNSVSVHNNLGLDPHQNSVAPSLGTVSSALEAGTSITSPCSSSIWIPDSKIRFPCTTIGCDRTFTRAGDMRRHARKHDSAAERFPCQVAGCKYTGAKAFARKDKLADHVKRHPV